MEGWQPLAPTKRASGVYSRAGTGYSPANGVGGLTGRFGAASLSSNATEEETATEKRRWQILQGPSDPFPPVGIFPRSVTVRILSNLTIADQRNCALAGRALAAAVADESNWKRRLDALDWCHVDGLTIKGVKGSDGEERHVGRRRKGKRREESDPVTERESITEPSGESIVPSSPIREASNTAVANAKAEENDDDFGDFAGPTKDAFADFAFDSKFPPSGGSSLASGKASLAMGGGRPLNFTSAGAPIFNTQPLIPIKLGGGSGANSTNKIPARTAVRTNGSVFSYAVETKLVLCSTSPSFCTLKAYAIALRPFLRSLADTTASASNSLLFTCDLGLSAQTALLSNLLRFISTSVGGASLAGKNRHTTRQQHSIDGLQDEESISSRAQDAAHRLLSNLLSSFEGTLARRSDAIRAASHGADTARAIRRAEDDLQTHANGTWELGNARLALALSEGSELAKGDVEDQFGRMKAADLFLERCPVITEGLAHNPLDNLSKQNDVAVLDFTAMDTFIVDLIDIIRKDGEIIARVFPPEQDVLLAYADRVAQTVLSKYTQAFLGHVKNVSVHLYLRSCAATFTQSLKLVDVLMQIEPRDPTIVTKERCQDVINHVWEGNVEEYLRSESEWVRHEMQAVTEKWEADVENNESRARTDAAFLTAQNPAAVKRSVLSGFKDVLLLPVTVVPRTAGIVGGAVIRTAGSGLSTLNPLRWQSGGAATAKMGGGGGGGSSNDLNASKLGSGNASMANLPRTPNSTNEKGYMDFSEGAIGTMDSDSDSEHGDDYNGGDATRDMNEHDEWNQEVAMWSAVASSRPIQHEEKKSKRRSKAQHELASRAIGSSTSSSLRAPSPSRPGVANTISSDTSRERITPKVGLSKMQLLLSLDTALQVIHVNRDCLKRIETFKGYPEPYGGRVENAIREVSLLLFRALDEGHMAPGFESATKQIQAWKPEDQPAETSDQDGHQEVEPLVHFFELVHVGDTIAQMVQVYFDQEISRHIDKNDFLNPVVKGRKRFESHLDELVARGLNAGVDLLLGQAEHIITSRQSARDYNPAPGQLTDLSPTQACKEAVACLKLHCRMLLGSTDKNVLEVFYQEVGIRLHAIICKTLKRQLISLDGGFRVIADLNEYYNFVASLRQPTLTADFSYLKMLGNLYIIDNPKELAKLARDANMFGGTLSPEDLYEFLQARADFRSIEKAIDKEMYGFKVSEDCCIV